MVLAGCIPERKRVDARLRGRGFYRSCAAAPNDGFGPGTAPPSGLVQRGVIKPTPWRQGERLRRHFIMRPKGAGREAAINSSPARAIPPPLNPPAASGQNLLNLLNLGCEAAPQAIP